MLEIEDLVVRCFVSIVFISIYRSMMILQVAYLKAAAMNSDPLQIASWETVYFLCSLPTRIVTLGISSHRPKFLLYVSTKVLYSGCRARKRHT